eukprot:gene43701-63782_t
MTAPGAPPLAVADAVALHCPDPTSPPPPDLVAAVKAGQRASRRSDHPRRLGPAVLALADHLNTSASPSWSERWIAWCDRNGGRRDPERRSEDDLRRALAEIGPSPPMLCGAPFAVLRGLEGAAAGSEARRVERLYKGRMSALDLGQLIAAFARVGTRRGAEDARRVLDTMPTWGVPRAAPHYGAAIKACGGDWRAAEALLRTHPPHTMCVVGVCREGDELG